MRYNPERQCYNYSQFCKFANICKNCKKAIKCERADTECEKLKCFECKFEGRFCKN